MSGLVGMLLGASLPSSVLAQDSPTGEAAAALPTATLEYRAAPGCPDRQAFEDLVLARLGYGAFRAEAPLHIDVVFEADAAAGYVGRVRGRSATDDGPAAERQVEGARCDDIASALAVAVALAVDPLGRGARLSAEGPRRPLDPALSGLDDERPVRAEVDEAHGEAGEVAGPPAPAAPDDDPHLRVGLFGAGLYELLPELTLGAGLFGELSFLRALSIGLEARFDVMPAPVETGGTQVEGAIFRGGLLVCFQRVFFRACGTLHAGMLGARTLDALDTRSREVAVADAGARVGVQGTFEDFSFGADLGVVVPLLRPSLVLHERTVWTAPPASGALHLWAALDVL